MPAAPSNNAVLSHRDWEQPSAASRPEDVLGLIGHCLMDETGADGVLIAAEAAPGDVLNVNVGASLSFLVDEPADGVLGYALRTTALTTQRMPGPDGSGFGEIVLGVIRSPAGRRGAICLGFGDRRFRQRESMPWMLDTYARLAAICLDDGDGFRRLVAAATMDGLTGCLNYTALMRTLDAEIERADRYGHKLSVCFVDLDAFKQLNDDEGHEAGNRVLAEVARILHAQARASDTVARYGGDEFVLLLPETSLRSALRLASRLRGAVVAASTPAGLPLSASAGVAQWRAGLSAEALLTAADDALRKAKASGSGVEKAAKTPALTSDV